MADLCAGSVIADVHFLPDTTGEDKRAPSDLAMELESQATDPVSYLRAGLVTCKAFKAEVRGDATKVPSLRRALAAQKRAAQPSPGASAANSQYGAPASSLHGSQSAQRPLYSASPLVSAPPGISPVLPGHGLMTTSGSGVVAYPPQGGGGMEDQAQGGPPLKPGCAESLKT